MVPEGYNVLTFYSQFKFESPKKVSIASHGLLGTINNELELRVGLRLGPGRRRTASVSARASGPLSGPG